MRWIRSTAFGWPFEPYTGLVIIIILVGVQIIKSLM